MICKTHYPYPEDDCPVCKASDEFNYIVAYYYYHLLKSVEGINDALRILEFIGKQEARSNKDIPKVFLKAWKGRIEKIMELTKIYTIRNPHLDEVIKLTEGNKNEKH